MSSYARRAQIGERTMATSGCDQVWSKAICDDIASAVMTTVNQIRCAQRVFHPTVLGNGQTSVPNHILGGPGPLTIQEGSTKPLIELSFEFALTHTQVDAEGSLHNGKTLALLAAKAVARAEDAILFMGEHANLPRGVQVANRDSAGAGLVGAAGATIEVSTNPADGYPGSILESVAR